MTNSLKASPEGLAIVNQARQRRGWTKTSTARWWQDAHTSRATLRRFWQGERIQQEVFIAICQAVGIHNWQAIATPNDSAESDFLEVNITRPQMDLNEAPDVESFYGYSQELEQLEQWIVVQRYKLVQITGMGGMGKTAMALALADRIQPQFEWLIWRSLQAAPTLLHLLDSLLETLEQTVAQDVESGIAHLIYHLQKRRCLLVLDGLEAVLQKPVMVEDYAQFLQRLSRDRHQSCLLITTREQFSAIDVDRKTAGCLSLRGLQQSAALELLQTIGLTGPALGLAALVRLYGGNPLALKTVVPLIQSIFGGNVAIFLSQNTLVIGDRLRSLLKQQVAQLSDLERDILYWLVIWQEPISFCRLQTHLFLSPGSAAVLEAIVTLERRSLLAKWFSDDGPLFTLQPLVMQVAMEQLIEQAIQEMVQMVQSRDVQGLKVLRSHWLLRPGSDDVAGDRILTDLREQLLRIYGSDLVQVLHQIHLLFKEQSPLAIGYAGCNLMTILKIL